MTYDGALAQRLRGPHDAARTHAPYLGPAPTLE